MRSREFPIPGICMLSSKARTHEAPSYPLLGIRLGSMLRLLTVAFGTELATCALQHFLPKSEGYLTRRGGCLGLPATAESSLCYETSVQCRDV
jgi:hypothetical protein